MEVYIGYFNRKSKNNTNSSKKIERAYYPFHLNTTIPTIITPMPINFDMVNLI